MADHFRRSARRNLRNRSSVSAPLSHPATAMAGRTANDSTSPTSPAPASTAPHHGIGPRAGSTPIQNAAPKSAAPTQAQFAALAKRLETLRFATAALATFLAAEIFLVPLLRLVCMRLAHQFQPAASPAMTTVVTIAAAVLGAAWLISQSLIAVLYVRSHHTPAAQE